MPKTAVPPTAKERPRNGSAAIVPIVPRLLCFAAAGWSAATGKRREKSDPRLPRKVQIGPNRYGFRADEWQRYLDEMPIASGSAAPDPARQASARTAATAGVAKRREKAAAKLAAATPAAAPTQRKLKGEPKGKPTSKISSVPNATAIEASR